MDHEKFAKISSTSLLLSVGAFGPRSKRAVRNGISHEFNSVEAFLARRQDNSPILYIGVQWITWSNIESAAKRFRKNDLSLRRYFGLHGKTILPIFSNSSQVTLTG